MTMFSMGTVLLCVAQLKSGRWSGTDRTLQHLPAGYRHSTISTTNGSCITPRVYNINNECSRFSGSPGRTTHVQMDLTSVHHLQLHA